MESTNVLSNSQGIKDLPEVIEKQANWPKLQLPPPLYDHLTEILKEVEAQKGSPPNLIELQHAFVKKPGDFPMMVPMVRGLFLNLWNINTTYMDKFCGYLSTTKWNDDYYKFDEYFDLKFKPLGYVRLENEKIVPGESTKVVEFTEFWDIINSSDEQKLKDASWLFEDNEIPKFLNEKAAENVVTTGNRVGYLSFPRCGNSFLRKYLHNITGIQTGADMGMPMGLGFQQTMLEFIGEEHFGASVWVQKSHDPMWLPGNHINRVNKVICCVRNPFDMIASMMHFISGTHSTLINEDFSKDIPQYWQENIRNMVKAQAEYFTNMEMEIKTHVPVYYLRYEDLLAKPQEVLESLFCFLLNRESIEGLNIQRRITAVVAQGHKKSIAYAQKVDHSILTEKMDKMQISEKKVVHNRSWAQFNQEQVEYISNELKDFMEMFGYAAKIKDGETDKDRYTFTEAWVQEQQTEYNFAKYPELNEEQLNYYLKVNKESLAQVVQLAKDNKLNEKAYVCNYFQDNQIKTDGPIWSTDMLMSVTMKEKPQTKKE